MRNKLAAAPYLLWMFIFILAPLAVVAYFAFTDRSGAFTLSNLASLQNYTPIFVTSVVLALIAALICLIIAYPVAYFMALADPFIQRLLMMLVMLPMCMSFLLRTMALVALLDDTGIINSFLGNLGIAPLPLTRNNAAVVLGMVYNFLPYMILPLYTVMEKIDPRLIEAAQDLGCDSRQTFTKVILPLSKSGIISGFTMVFVPAVSTFYISNKLGGTSTVLIGDVIESQFKTAYNPNLGAAMALGLMVLVLLCIFLMNHFTDDDDEEVITL
ncbi:MAG: transporter permease [Firmicutes bacterium]|nr:transporter permease [Bacillota bacterium]